METNILGLPSLTGYTPLKATLEGQVLKYDFKGIGPIVIDKSGNGNRGELMPREDPPRRKILSWPPLEMAIALDGENDHVKTPDTPDLDFESNDIFPWKWSSPQNRSLLADPDLSRRLITKRTTKDFRYIGTLQSIQL